MARICQVILGGYKNQSPATRSGRTHPSSQFPTTDVKWPCRAYHLATFCCQSPNPYRSEGRMEGFDNFWSLTRWTLPLTTVTFGSIKVGDVWMWGNNSPCLQKYTPALQCKSPSPAHASQDQDLSGGNMVFGQFWLRGCPSQSLLFLLLNWNGNELMYDKRFWIPWYYDHLI